MSEKWFWARDYYIAFDAGLKGMGSLRVALGLMTRGFGLLRP